MYQWRLAGAGCALALTVVFVGGCGSEVDLASVEGTVTLDGAPLKGAVVEFQPTFTGRPSSGVTDASGHYELKYTMKSSGALVGEHVVRITMQEAADMDEGGGEVTADEAAAGNSDEEPDAAMAGIPAKYNRESELKATVKSGRNKFDFPLESAK